MTQMLGLHFEDIKLRADSILLDVEMIKVILFHQFGMAQSQ